MKAESPIKTLKDTDGKTIAFSGKGSSTDGIVTAYMKQYQLKAIPTATGGPAGVGEAVGRAVRSSITAGVFILLTITLTVYGQSGNFHLSG